MGRTTPYKRQPCADCGGIKDRGRGSLYCTACLEAMSHCMVCGEQTRYPRRTCSDECLSEQRSAQGFRVMAVRPPRARKPLPAEWTCSRCSRTKPLTVEFFNVEKRDLETGRIIRFGRWCRTCKAEDSRERYQNRTPEQIERMRQYSHAVYEMRKADPVMAEQDRLRKQRWAQRNADKVAAAARRYRKRLMTDPKRRAARLEADRIAHRLQVERETGKFPERRFQTAVNAYRMEVGNCARNTSVEPLALWVDTVLHEDHRDIEEIAVAMDASPRALWRIQDREYDRVTPSLADRLLWHYGRPVRMPPAERIERELAERCESLPGNGIRLLRYLDLAELVAHLPGVVVDSVEDLWPELAEDEA